MCPFGPTSTSGLAGSRSRKRTLLPVRRTSLLSNGLPSSVSLACRPATTRLISASFSGGSGRTAVICVAHPAPAQSNAKLSQVAILLAMVLPSPTPPSGFEGAVRQDGGAVLRAADAEASAASDVPGRNPRPCRLAKLRADHRQGLRDSESAARTSSESSRGSASSTSRLLVRGARWCPGRFVEPLAPSAPPTVEVPRLSDHAGAHEERHAPRRHTGRCWASAAAGPCGKGSRGVRPRRATPCGLPALSTFDCAIR